MINICPLDILTEILQYLKNPKDLMNLISVCKHNYNIIYPVYFETDFIIMTLVYTKEFVKWCRKKIFIKNHPFIRKKDIIIDPDIIEYFFCYDKSLYKVKGLYLPLIEIR